MHLRALCLVTASLLSACAAAPAPAPEAVAQVDDAQHCSFEARIGTSIPSTQCVRKAQRQRAQHETRQTIDDLRRASSRPPVGDRAGN
jgi:hypothetical protein